MKATLLFLFISLSFFKIDAQCTENVSGFGNNPDETLYNVSGDVEVVLNDDNTITLNLASNYGTAPGPDVRAFLVVSDGKSDSELAKTLIADLEHFEIGLTQSSGAQTFTVAVPENKNITKFDKVFFYCLQYDHFWDLGTYTSFSQSNCAVLSIQDSKIDQLKIYPNPAKNNIQIQNFNFNSGEIRIFNVLGKQVIYQTKNLNKTIDISSLKSGIYIVKISSEGKSKTQKLVIE